MADIKIDSDSGKFKAGADQDLEVYSDGSHSYIKNTVNDQTIILSTKTGGTNTSGITLDGSNNLTLLGNIIMGDDTSIGIADDAERIEFDGAGDISFLGANVGIGVSDPDSSLEINSPDNVTATALKVLALDDGGYDGTVLEVYGTRGPTTSYNIAKFGTNAGTAKIVFDGEGKVGIGTASPAEVLHIDEPGDLGGIFIHSNSNGHRMQIDIDATVTSDAEIGDIIFRNAGDSVAAIQVFREGANDAANMRFSTQAASGSMSERMRIDSTGNVGIGTMTPGVPFEIMKAVAGGALEMVMDNSDATTSLDETVGFRFRHNGGTGFRVLMGKDDTFQANASKSGHLKFMAILADTETEAMRIASSGNVGIGDTSPTYLLDVNRATSGVVGRFNSPNAYNAEASIELGYGGKTKIGSWIETGGGSPGSIFRIYNTPAGGSITETFKVEANGDTYTNDGSVSSLSDKRIKKNVEDLVDGIELLMQLRPVSFQYNGKAGMASDNGVVRYGMIADEVLAIAPQYVTISNEELDGKMVSDFKSLSISRMIPMVIKSIQELSEQNTALKSRIEALENA